MLTFTREMAARSSMSDLHLLKALFNKLAEDDLDARDCRCCHGSIQMIRAELGRPGRF
jgi:hypothetical protein